MIRYVIRVAGLKESKILPELASGDWYLAGAIQDSMHLTSSVTKAQIFATESDAKAEVEIRKAWSDYRRHQTNQYTVEEVTI